MNKHYGEKFYDAQHQLSLKSASATIPCVLSLFNPESVLDVGCGLGTWLSVFRKKSLQVFGIDGDWVSQDRLFVPKEFFKPMNLEELEFEGKTYDLAMSLEVAEHISPAAGKRLVEYLTRSAPVVMFSAAIPNQGGSNHVNEQWFGYWIDLFESFDFTCRDAIRKLIWENPDVSPWYKQNILMFVEKSKLELFPGIDKAESIASIGPRFEFVHPELFRRAASLESCSGKQMAKELARRFKRRALGLFKQSAG